MALLVKRFRQSSVFTFVRRRSFSTVVEPDIPLAPLEEAVRRIAAGPAEARPDHYKLAYQWAQSLYWGEKSFPFKTIPRRLGWFTHGLWPHTANDDLFCSKNPQPLMTEKDIKDIMDILGTKLIRHLFDLWPDLKDCDNLHACFEFCVQQWNKHGSHTGFTFEEYVGLTLQLTIELIDAHPDGPNSRFGVQMDTPMTIAAVYASLSIPFKNWRLGSVFQGSYSEVEVHGKVGTKNDDNVAELRVWIDSLFATTIKSSVRFSGSSKSKRPVMAQIPSTYPSKGSEKLSKSWNNMYLGAYSAVIDNSNIPDLSPDEIVDRNYIFTARVFVLEVISWMSRDIFSNFNYFSCVACDGRIDLQAVKLLALYFSSTPNKEMAISRIFEWQGDPSKRDNPTFHLIAGIIFLNERNYNEALKFTGTGASMELNHIIGIHRICYKSCKSDYIS
ncbi:coatomer epsilon subunit [Striga asiatica]|uniref:Coatomer epsilon subunit n=1 Tax=Striga asiatica TaxID=4170 RepID=A0A5A7PE99_STRAF|nr:coatomer epsilon subunit [Striga asiatica]